MPSSFMNGAVFNPRNNGTAGGNTGAGFVSPSSGVPSNIDEITKLINNLNLQGQAQANAARIPGATALEAQSSANITDELQGKVPEDVLRLIKQQAAERGVAGGISGSPNEDSAYLRALGLTSLDLQRTGQGNLSAALARNPAAPLYDPSQNVLTPYQAGSLSNDAAFRTQQFDLERAKFEEAKRQYNQQSSAAYGPKEFSQSHSYPGAIQPVYDYRYYA